MLDFNLFFEYIKYNFLSLLSIIVPTIVAIFIFYLQRKKKKINLFVIYNWKIINSSNSIINKKLSIKFWDKEINDLGLLIFEIKNTWNVIIDKNDFIDNKDLVIEFNWWEILVSNLKETTPDYLKEDVWYSILWNKLLINPFTINTWDSLIFEVLANWDIEKIISKPRIKWIKEIKKVNFNFSKIKYFIFMALFLYWAMFIKYYDKALFENKSVIEVFKSNEILHNNFLKVMYYIFPIITFYFFYKFIKIEIIADKLRWRVKWDSFLKNLINKFR